MDHVAGADRFELAFDFIVGGDHVHVGTVGFDFCPRQWKTTNPPTIEAPALRDADLF
jgi:hypothetical protein